MSVSLEVTIVQRNHTTRGRLVDNQKIEISQHQMAPGRFFLVALFLISGVTVVVATNTTDRACPRPAVGHCTCSWTSYYSVVKCNGLAEIPLDIPINTTRLVIVFGTIKHVPERFFRQFRFLNAMNLESNQISNRFELPKRLWNLRINDNRLNTSTIYGMFSGLQRLRTLILEGNPLQDLIPGTFSDLHKLMNLDLSGTGLRNIKDGAFSGLHTLGILNLMGNQLTRISKGMFKGITGDNFQRMTLMLSRNQISEVEDGAFTTVSGIAKLQLDNNQLTKVPDLRGLSENVQMLELSYNRITDLASLNKAGIKTFTILSLAHNDVSVINNEMFSSFSVRKLLDLSCNRIGHLPRRFLQNSPRLNELLLHSNQIRSIDPDAFFGLENLQGLYMFDNKINSLPDGIFGNLSLINLFLHSNNFTKLTGRPFREMKKTEATVYMFANEVQHISDDYLKDLDRQTTVAVKCKSLKDLPHLGASAITPRIVCAPYYLDWVKGQRNEVAKALRKSGFRCKRNYDDDWDCILCEAGTYGDENRQMCVTCSAGGFYQDDMGQTRCKECNVGTFVHPNNTPATTPTSCQACPQGTKSGEKAMFRACKCLANFYRLNRFGKCSPCPHKGLKCEKDYALLTKGYYWKWKHAKWRNQYSEFIQNLMIGNRTFQHGILRFDGELPATFQCPRESCLGGLDSNCTEGYQGPLCAICKPHYFDRMNRCIRCPSKLRASLQIVGVIVVFILVLLAVVWGDKRRVNDGKRTVADVILSCFKIVVGFYQVMAGMYSAFTNISWPRSVVWIQKTLHYIQLNVLEIAPISCLTELLSFNALQQFVLVMSGNTAVVLSLVLYLAVRIKVLEKKSTLSGKEKEEAINATKSSCIRNICVFLFATYPTTCAKIIQILPPNCVELCFDSHRGDCARYLRSDYSVLCYTAGYQTYWRVAAGFMVYPIGFPVAILVLVWKYIRLPLTKDNCSTVELKPMASSNERARKSALTYTQSTEKTNVRSGLSLFYENYKPECWYWETVEMGRKLILTSGLALIGEHSRTQVGLGAIISALFAILYVYLRPIANKFENLLQTIALMAIFLNLSIGVMLKVPDEKVSPTVNQHNDDVGVSVLLIVINTAVIAIVIVTCVKVLALRLYRWMRTADKKYSVCQCCGVFWEILFEPAFTVLVGQQ